MSNAEEEYAKIQKEVKLKKGFYLHLGIYAIIICFLWAINALTEGPGHRDWWFLFPAVSWGVAVAIHALVVFVFSSVGILGDDWEQKQIESALEKNNLSQVSKQLPSDEQIDMDQHLNLKELAKKSTYDEQDLV